MGEQGNRVGRVDSPRRSPRSHGWCVRAEQAHGEPFPEPSWTLSALEIGAYAFCPQAWFLQRCRLPVEARPQLLEHPLLQLVVPPALPPPR